MWKRVIAFVMVFVMAVGIWPTQQVSAATYNQRASAMINYFKDSSLASFDASNITDKDLRMFAIYISNFYIPFYTNASNMKECVEEAVASIKGTTVSNLTANDKSLIESLVNAIETNIKEKSKKLDSVETLNKLFAKDDLKLSGLNIDLSGKTTTGFRSNITDGNVGTSILSLCLAKAYNKYENGINGVIDVCYLESDSSQVSVEGHGAADYELYLSPFGDVVACTPSSAQVFDFYIIIPGCLNPATFGGSTLPLFNTYFMSNLNGAIDSSGDDTVDIIDSEGNTVTSGVAVDRNKGAELNRLVDKGSMVITYALYDTDAKEPKKGTMDLSDFDATPKIVITYGSNFLDSLLKTKGGQIRYSEASSESGNLIYGDIYGDFTNKYKDNLGFDEDARRRIISSFTSTIIDVSCFDTNAIMFSSENTPKEFNIFKAATDNDNIASITQITKNGKYVGTLGGNSDWDRQIQTVNKGTYALLKYQDETVAQLVNLLRTAKATGSQLFPYAEMYYTYMMMEFNDSALPACDSKLLSDWAGTISAAGQVAAGDGVDQDLGLKLKANEMLDTLKSLTNPSYNEAKGGFIDRILGSWILKQHRKMLGITNVSSMVSNDAVAYSGFSGHVTTPRLRDIELTANMLEKYRDVYFVLLATLLLFTIFMLMLRMRSPMQALTTFVIMAIILVLPQSGIDMTIQLSNTVNEQLYNGRFNYWAILQHQMALTGKAEALDSGSSVADAVSNTVTNLDSYYSDTGVRLKWLSPKKNNKADELLENGGATDVAGADLFKWLFTNYMNQETYSEDAGSTYVYRTYTSLSKDAEALFQEIKGNVSNAYNMSGTFGAYAEGTTYLYNLLALDGGLTATDKFGNTMALFADSANNGGVYKDTVTKTSYVESGRITCLYSGMETLMNADVQSSLQHNLDIKNGTTDAVNTVNLYCTGVSPDEFKTGASLYNYGLYSESPYYYFYNTLRSIKLTEDEETIGADESGKSTFLSILLAESPYKVVDGEMIGYCKDFLDLESLFTYIIPYLEASNEFVIDWTDLYGLEYTDINDPNMSEQDKRELMGKVWNMYSPWVDALYSTNIYSGKIRSGGFSEGVINAFSPYSYEGYGYRPMVFSEADMHYNGVSYNDLSEVERKIQEVLDMTYTDFRYLANYANFSDEALASAAAMIATFNFNTVFSQSKIGHETITLYPQGYEMKSFSYDAFLRLIMLNSTGASPLSQTDIYTEIIRNTSIWTGLALLLTDLLAVYVVPGAKFLYVVCAFILSLVMCVGIYLQKLDQAFKVVINAIVIPMLSFFAISFGHALATSCLMGEGLTEYVGSQMGSWVTNDPTISLLVLMLINGATAFLLIKQLVGLVKTLIAWTKDTVGAMTGILTAIGGAVTAKVTEFANTGKVTFAGGKTAAQDAERRWQEKNGVGYRATSDVKPLNMNTGSMPMALSRKLAATGKNIGNAVKTGASTVANSKAAKAVGAVVVAGAAGAGAAALAAGKKVIGKPATAIEKGVLGVRQGFSNVGHNVKSKIKVTGAQAKSAVVKKQNDTKISESKSFMKKGRNSEDSSVFEKAQRISNDMVNLDIDKEKLQERMSADLETQLKTDGDNAMQMALDKSKEEVTKQIAEIDTKREQMVANHTVEQQDLSFQYNEKRNNVHTNYGNQKIAAKNTYAAEMNLLTSANLTDSERTARSQELLDKYNASINEIENLEREALNAVNAQEATLKSRMDEKQKAELKQLDDLKAELEKKKQQNLANFKEEMHSKQGAEAQIMKDYYDAEQRVLDDRAKQLGDELSDMSNAWVQEVNNDIKEAGRRAGIIDGIKESIDTTRTATAANRVAEKEIDFVRSATIREGIVLNQSYTNMKRNVDKKYGNGVKAGSFVVGNALEAAQKAYNNRKPQ